MDGTLAIFACILLYLAARAFAKGPAYLALSNEGWARAAAREAFANDWYARLTFVASPLAVMMVSGFAGLALSRLWTITGLPAWLDIALVVLATSVGWAVGLWMLAISRAALDAELAQIRSDRANDPEMVRRIVG